MSDALVVHQPLSEGSEKVLLCSSTVAKEEGCTFQEADCWLTGACARGICTQAMEAAGRADEPFCGAVRHSALDAGDQQR